MTWTLPAILNATGADLLRWGPGPFRSLSTDSRRIGSGEVFVALSGPHHDGHDFLESALARGASGLLVDRGDSPVADDVALLRVNDTLEAFGDLAAAWRRRLTTRVVAVTGSNGKTTTKEMIASVLAAGGFRVARSAGTENNLVGVPQTLLRLTGDEDFAVVEMGMNHAGEIWRLAGVSRPEVGVITNVGPAHLEGLGSLANIAAAKGELALAMAPSATLIVNGGDPRLAAIAESFPGPRILAGIDGRVRLVAAEPAEGFQNLSLGIDGRTVTARLAGVGAHNAANALLAATTGAVLGLSAEAIVAGLEAFVPPPMRLEIVRLPGGARIWNDAYNANPASVEAALASLAAEPARRRIAVLGEMWELGEHAAACHREIGLRAAECGVDLLFAVGPHAAEIADGARQAGLPEARIRRCEAAAAVVSELRANLGEGDVVLVKGSRGARMEEVVLGLQGAA